MRLSLSKKVASLLLALAGCTWTAGCTCADTGIFDSRFICSTGNDCAEGYFCDRFSGECIRNGGSMGGGGGGGMGGGGGGEAGGMGGGGGLDEDGGVDGGMDGGGPDGGILQLVITSSLQAVPVGTCSQPITFEVRNGQVLTGVPTATTVTFSATPPGVLGLFRGSGCTTAGTLSLAPDASTGSFSFFAGDGGTFNLALTAPALVGATQATTTTWPALSSLVFLGTSQTVRAGDCSAAISVELRDAANNPTKANAPVGLALSATPAPGVLFYSDPLCQQAILQATVPTGASRATFYAARETGLAYTLTAAAGTISATRPHTILPVVRSGACLISDNDAGTTCAVVPPVVQLSDSFLLYQVSTPSNVAGAVAVQCELDAVSNITCRRGQPDSDAVITWQVAEVRGATVRKATTFCDGGLSVPLGATAPPGSSFVLTANENDGFTIDESDFNIGRLNDAGTGVDFTFGGGCTGTQSMIAQVVTLPNTVVARGATSLATAATSRSIMDPPAPMAGVLLAQWRLPNTVGAGICDRSLRTELQGNSLNFTRGNGTANAFCSTAVLPSIVYEKVDFRTTATVQQVLLTMGVGATTANGTVTAVDRTRTLVFSGAQGSTGMALGEGTHVGSTNTSDYLGDVSASFTLGGPAYQSTMLSARRGSALGASRWSAWVVELNP